MSESDALCFAFQILLFLKTFRHKKRSKKESESEDTEDSESVESEGEVWLEKKSE